MLSATHLINLFPMENLHWKSPFETLYGKQPPLHDLRTIGCVCYAHNVGENDKLTPRATKSVLLGYTFGLKWYKLYDLEHKKIFHSKEVVFQENIFPFKKAPMPQVDTGGNSLYDSLFPIINSQIFSANDSPISVPCPSHSITQTFSNPVIQPMSDTLIPSVHSPSSHVPSSSYSSPLQSSHRDIQSSPSISSAPSASLLPLPRKSTRPKGPPTWLKDFVCMPSTAKQSTTINSQSSTSQSFHANPKTVNPYPLFTPFDLTHFSSCECVASTRTKHFFTGLTIT